MNKTFLYLALLLLVGGGVYFLVFNKSGNLFGKNEAAFTVKDIDDITKIYLARTNGETILLQKTDTGWLLNNQYQALNSTVYSLLQTLRDQQASYPVPKNMHNTVIQIMSGNSVKVEVYGTENKKLTSFFVGSEGPNYKGTFMLTEGAEKPYVVEVPGFKGFLTSRYSTDIADWRDRSVFRLQPDEIRSVSVSYDEEPLNSFTIVQQGNNVKVETSEDIGGSNPLNENRVRSFLKFFTSLNSEGYVNGVYKMDSVIASTKRRAVIESVSTKGRKQHVDVYYMPLNKRSKNQLSNSEEAFDLFDTDRYFAVLNNYKDTVVIQRFVFDKVFRRAYEFYQKDAPTPVMGIDKNKN